MAEETTGNWDKVGTALAAAALVNAEGRVVGVAAVCRDESTIAITMTPRTLNELIIDCLRKAYLADNAPSLPSRGSTPPIEAVRAHAVGLAGSLATGEASLLFQIGELRLAVALPASELRKIHAQVAEQMAVLEALANATPGVPH